MAASFCEKLGLFAVCRQSNIIEIWDAKVRNVLVQYWTEKDEQIRAVIWLDWLSDCGRFCVFCLNGTIKVFSLDSLTAIQVILNPNNAIWTVSLSFSKEFFFAGFEDGFVRQYEFDEMNKNKVVLKNLVRSSETRVLSLCDDLQNGFFCATEDGQVRHFNEFRKVVLLVDVRETRTQHNFAWSLQFFKGFLVTGC